MRIGVVKPGTAQKGAMKTVFVYIHVHLSHLSSGADAMGHLRPKYKGAQSHLTLQITWNRFMQMRIIIRQA
jgi:hypothetical protein